MLAGDRAAWPRDSIAPTGPCGRRIKQVTSTLFARARFAEHAAGADRQTR